MNLRFICHITINLVIKRIIHYAQSYYPEGLLPKGNVEEVQEKEFGREKIDSFKYWTLFCDFKLTEGWKSLSTRQNLSIFKEKVEENERRALDQSSFDYLQMLIKRQLKALSTIIKCRTIDPLHSKYPLFAYVDFHPQLLRRIAYSKVNVPIDSKYYHEQLPGKVSQILELIVKEKKLNEKGMLLEHLANVIVEDPRIILTKDQESLIGKQLNLWKGRKGRFEKVATIAWVISKLKLFKYHKELYEEIAERVSNDQWYVNFDESLKALEAFTYLENEELKDYIYPRIERNLNITVWEFNMISYKRITVGLLENHRFESQLWDKLEDHILKNLGMQYSLTTLTDIFMSYALAQRGSQVFYQMLQKAIYLGHWYDYDLKHKILPGYDQTGQFYALLVQTYSIAKTNCSISLLPDFLDFIYKGVASRTTNYQKLSSFTKIVQYLPGLFEEEDQEEIIKNLLEHKKPTSILYQEIIEFYDLMSSKSIKLPLKLHQHIEKVLLSDINKKLIPPSKVLEICEQLFNKGYVLNPADFQQAIENSVTYGFKYLQAEEARSVVELSSKSKFLANKTKEILSLPNFSTNK